MNYNGEPIKKNNYQCGIGDLSHIDITSYNRYCLQQSLYNYMLERKYGIQRNKMYLIVMHPNCETCHKVRVSYLEDEVKQILQSL